MKKDYITTILGAAFIVGILFAFILIVIEDGTVVTFLKKLGCRYGRHTSQVKIGSTKINKYYCEYCKAPRKHPDLKVLDGGNKKTDNRSKEKK